ncbi:hypothetical protein K450DRAFT_240504 [Umbelopsis ramanniana AG]|uniref:WWE domain-containing protein n=1 Tax=Umbelopsis ramanniana AG TaxID=1314678 RepID=A0AAD5EAN2_UMBRA|nr:uncharacterized protein K450DRAFT_240504 [Umbelopsis ramanniana AG]KAI8579822.1 hypothetical protein K450DRAFT_240504 [Umbelopsis ramanniana AG]
MDILSNQEYDEEYHSKMKEIIDRSAKINLALKDGDESDDIKPQLRRSLSTSSSRRKHGGRHSYYEPSAQSDEDRVERKPLRRRSTSRRRKGDSSDWKVTRHSPSAWGHNHPFGGMDKGMPMFDPYGGPHTIPYGMPWMGDVGQADSHYLDEASAMMGYYGPHPHHPPGLMFQPPDLVPQEYPELYGLHHGPPPPLHHPPHHHAPPIGIPHMLPMHAMMLETTTISSPMLHPAMLPQHLPMDPKLDPGSDVNNHDPSVSHMQSPRMSARQNPAVGQLEWKWCFQTVSDEHGEQWMAFDDNVQLLLQDGGMDDQAAYEVFDSHIERGRKRIIVLPQRQYCFYRLHGKMIKIPVSLRKMTNSPH